ncbi:Copper amine oxidase N2-terminal [Penicillium longicatenatum]|uniref:Copper amine oxidase N2-terminal n=1 Tax=Penicillium longicatenatum TaxID=1561947 RepID=UPI0025469C93|nr:Copper amine oxidase N2-terminal [Penicillium longicatenatum]KAJ5635313.1 Copper amine oxidase N2-terminal [Penicillium longicatenatum]
MLLTGENLVTRQRARFAEHHIWVTRYRDGDLWAGGRWTEQSVKETDGVFDYAARNEDVKNEDIVIWHKIGMTHTATPEQFPVMGVESLSVFLKPADFFEFNPEFDVPQSTQAINNSVQIGVKLGQCC